MTTTATRLVLPPAALHGLPGEVVNTLGPHTEADPAALLLCYLTMLGSACPRPVFKLGLLTHPGRLFTRVQRLGHHGT
jgi:hypothetical protein